MRRGKAPREQPARPLPRAANRLCNWPGRNIRRRILPTCSGLSNRPDPPSSWDRIPAAPTRATGNSRRIRAERSGAVERIMITEIGQYMTFKLGNELFAIDVAQVREVLEVSTITRVPT